MRETGAQRTEGAAAKAMTAAMPTALIQLCGLLTARLCSLVCMEDRLGMHLNGTVKAWLQNEAI